MAVTCKHCNFPGLIWIETDRGWRLGHKDGEIHSCEEFIQGREEQAKEEFTENFFDPADLAAAADFGQPDDEIILELVQALRRAYDMLGREDAQIEALLKKHEPEEEVTAEMVNPDFTF